MSEILKNAGFQVQVSGDDTNRCAFATLYISVPALGGLAPAPDAAPSLPDSGGYKVELRMKRVLGVFDKMIVRVSAMFVGNTLSEFPIPLLAAAPPVVWQELKRFYTAFSSNFAPEQTLFVEEGGTPISFLNDRDLMEEWMLKNFPPTDEPNLLS